MFFLTYRSILVNDLGIFRKQLTCVLTVYLKVFCARIFHTIYKFAFCLADNEVFCKKICEILDSFSHFPAFWQNFDVFCKRILFPMCSTRKILVKFTKRTKNTSGEMFFTLCKGGDNSNVLDILERRQNLLQNGIAFQS